MEKEIVKELHLTKNQENLLDMHSFLNIMNVLIAELELFHFESQDPLIKKSIEFSNIIKDSLSENSDFIISDDKFKEYRTFILNSLEEVFKKYPEMEANNDIDPGFENIKTIFKVLEVRLIEFRSRLNEPLKWEYFLISELKSSLTDFFGAVEKNSNGKYRIIYNIARQDQKDYLVDIKIESKNNVSVYMPSAFKDVIRDISANARKYTEFGGEITIGLWDDGHKLSFVVQDTGKGIPEEEIDLVVDFGHRASNISQYATKGGGFGLTKAYFITRLNNGRMWIKSKINNGTRIKIEIPYPVDK